MENKELLFDVIDTLAFPVLVLIENEKGNWQEEYSNESMESVFKEYSRKGKKLEEPDEKPDEKSDEKLEEKSDEDSKGYELALDETLLMLIDSYKGDSDIGPSTHHDLELFGRIYDIHISKSKKKLFIIFVEIAPKDIFDHITFHNMSRVCNAIIIVLDTNGELVDMNDCFCELIGVSKINLLGKNFFDNFIPGNKEKINEYFESILSQDIHHQHFITKMRVANDEFYRINWQVSKFIRGDNKYIIAIGSDVSKLVDENIDLKQQLTSIKVGFEYFPFAVGYMNAEGIFTKMNPRFMKMFRIEEEDENVSFDDIPLFKKNIGFEKMHEHIKLIKEMSYKIDHVIKGKKTQIKVDIRMLLGKKESSKFYIVVVSKV